MSFYACSPSFVFSGFSWVYLVLWGMAVVESARRLLRLFFLCIRRWQKNGGNQAVVGPLIVKA